MEIARNKAPETQITDPNYLSCICVDEKGRTKTVISTAERAAFVTLSDSAGRIYGEVSNICEPFDFTAHVFYLPEGTLDSPVTVHFVNLMDKSAYFAAAGDCGSATLTPDRVKRTNFAAVIAETDRHIQPVSVTETAVCDGVRCKELICTRDDGAPVLMYALFVDPSKAGFSAGTAFDGYAPGVKIQTVKGQAEAAIANGRRVVAATNADFYDMFGTCTPSGLCVKDGRTVSNGTTIRNFFGMDMNGRPVIGNFADNPELYGQLSCAVGGREIFLEDGEIADISPCEPFSFVSHPRTAAGICENGEAVLLVVDGRIPERSNGASLVDLARVMQSFHVKRAINLDGGGSSTFLIMKEGELTMLNRPADLIRPTEPLIREIYNSLQVIQY
ncbi:MAG: phosphodiester glycosidase family protein [Oscillospiraceae bacterium]|nr:phosphodiester glycosidase family protein [Oscillospiraceae bacterium]